MRDHRCVCILVHCLPSLDARSDLQATTRLRCNPTVVPTASTRACWRSAATITLGIDIAGDVWRDGNTDPCSGDLQRNVCLIPVSAHGTNPASAAVAGAFERGCSTNVQA